jgi:hypothetical protein
MANPRRGEVEAILDGTPLRLVLTLGALAELEQAFGAGDMLALAERFDNGRISANDAIRILGAGLRGGGNDITDATVASMIAPGGAAGYVGIVAALLRATFAADNPADSTPAGRGDASATPAGLPSASASSPINSGNL